MIVLDTNVVSELMRVAPDRRVLGWVAKHPASRLYVTTLSVAEVLTGVALLPAGRRRETLGAAARRTFDEVFARRCLSFDALCAKEYARIVSERQRAGRRMDIIDAQIAATAASRRAALATRNVADFTGCGIDVLDPWE